MDVYDQLIVLEELRGSISSLRGRFRVRSCCCACWNGTGLLCVEKRKKMMQGSLGLYTVRISVELERKGGWGRVRGKETGWGVLGWDLVSYYYCIVG
ncbi:hypothetical protein KY285_029697 [Solanum tuberosum]|nr:hypothetical protein KY285_029697 [Solanum tuberosum]